MYKLLIPMFVLVSFYSSAQDSLYVRNPSEGYALKKASVYENATMALYLEDTLFQADSIITSYEHTQGGPKGIIRKKYNVSYEDHKKRGLWWYQMPIKTAEEVGTHEVMFRADAYQEGKLVKAVEKRVSYRAQEEWSRDIEITVDEAGSSAYMGEQFNILLNLKNVGDVPFPNNTLITFRYFDGDAPVDSNFMSTVYNLGKLAPGEYAPIRVQFESWWTYGIIGGSTFTCFQIVPRDGGELLDDDMSNNSDCMQMYNLGGEESTRMSSPLLVHYANGSLFWNQPLEQASEVSVFDLNGACVWKGSLEEGAEHISLTEHFNSGIYLLRFTDIKGTRTSRFMVSQ